jgi:hypothetical protein
MNLREKPVCFCLKMCLNVLKHQEKPEMVLLGNSRLLATITLDYCELPILPNYLQLGFLGRFLRKFQVISGNLTVISGIYFCITFQLPAFWLSISTIQ